MAKLITVLGWLFLPLWLTIVVGGNFLGIREGRGLIDRNRAKAIGARIAIIFICYYFTIVGSPPLQPSRS